MLLEIEIASTLVGFVLAVRYDFELKSMTISYSLLVGEDQACIVFAAPTLSSRVFDADLMDHATYALASVRRHLPLTIMSCMA